MKIRVYSDIHLQLDHYDGSNVQWYPPALPNDKETTLILAGDIWIGSKFIFHGSDSWIGNVAQHFKQVLIVLGNHCYWPMGDLTIKNGGNTCNAMLQDMCLFNVHVLDCDTFQNGDVLFVGATLWTDMNKYDPLTMHRMSTDMNYDGKIAYETGPNGLWSRFTSDRWIKEHRRHRDYIKHVVEQNRDKKVIVITHHIPLLTLGDPNYLGDARNGYYHSDLSDLILDNENIKLWAYGHTHHQNDVTLEHCRLINNCVGYSSEHMEQQNLVKHEVIEV